jgi:acyl-CoA thioester hydrolase
MHRCGFRDIDPFGHMGMVAYYAYFADHRFAALRDRFGLDLKAIGRLTFGFFTTETKVQYLRQIRCDEPFTITSKVVANDDTSCLVECVLTKQDGSAAARCSMSVACVDLKSGRMTTWPEDFMERFVEQPL